MKDLACVQVQTDMYFDFHGHSRSAHQLLGPDGVAADGSITAEQSALDILAVLQKVTQENTGTFWNHDGTTIPW